ncbi:VCBS repeat-containing protein [Herpetosiphon sp.]|uniref:FG-GAP repeat protein n=1 Tax=Herpetosiphon aurantiacus (strain ATCC 23779 / DSM 785 / 114-95) TaxID=316274 RepID=A9B7L1_HERA2|nr:VCBS repeat-containing protein [Herpetosiphon sp.]ABX02984.1 hypothetical protein Haur_0332 [Herpetosiphon aurantiacus DSM 785]
MVLRRMMFVLLVIFSLSTVSATSLETPSAEPLDAASPASPAATNAYTMRAGFPATKPNGSYFSSPTVVDLFKDGSPEILSADATGCIWGYNIYGQLLPGFPWMTGGACANTPRINGSLVVADINEDGLLEIVVGTRGKGTSVGQRGKVIVYQRNGAILSGWPKEMEWAYITNGNFPEVVHVAVDDIIGDSKLEVIATTTNEAGSNTDYAPNVHAWYYTGNVVTGYPKSSDKGSGIWGHPALADLDNNGKSEIFVGRDELYFYRYKNDGTQYAGWPIQTYTHVNQTTWNVHDYIEFTRSGPAIADLDNDGSYEVIAAGKVRTPDGDPHNNYDPQSASAVFVTEPDGTRRPGWTDAKRAGAPLDVNFTPNNPIVVADLDGNGEKEFVVTFDDGTIRAYRENGTQIWSYFYAEEPVQGAPTRKVFGSEVVIADVTGDRKLDIVFGTYSFDRLYAGIVGLYALDARNGALHSGFPLSLPNEGTASDNSAGSQKGIQAAPTISDIDNNCYVEILAHSRAGNIYVWETLGRNLPELMPWPMSRQNLQRTAWVQNPPEPRQHVFAPEQIQGGDFNVYLPMTRMGCDF